MSIPVSIELYSLRELTQTDFLGTLDKVAEMGYNGVEFAGFFGIDASVLKEKLDSLGLIATSSHTPIDQIDEKLEEVITYNKAIGNTNIVIPWADTSDETNIENTVRIIRKAAPILAQNGMRLFYHNHKQEFVPYQEGYVMDYLMESEPLLYLQLDICWATKAGVAPTPYLEKYSGRTDLCHFKDIKVDTLTSVGTGEVDIASVVAEAHKLGMSAVVIENDRPQPDPLTDAKLSIDNLRKMGI
jgi:sugar phosphate isomerase/epimerase